MTTSAVPPESAGGTRPAERKVKPKGAGDGKPKTPEESQVVESAERSVPVTDVPSEQAGMKELLGQVGLGGLRLPSGGVLSRQWRDFLERLGLTVPPRPKPSEVSPERAVEARVPPVPPRPKPSEVSPERAVEARVPPGSYDGAPGRKVPPHGVDGGGFDDRKVEKIEIEGSMTKGERERALVALMKEGQSMPPSRSLLIAKVMEMRKKAEGRSNTSRQTRR